MALETVNLYPGLSEPTTTINPVTSGDTTVTTQQTISDFSPVLPNVSVLPANSPVGTGQTEIVTDETPSYIPSVTNAFQPSEVNTSAAPTTTGGPTWLEGITNPGTPGSATNPTSSTGAGSSSVMNATPGSTGISSWFPGWLRLGGGALAIVLILAGVLALVFLSRSSPARSATA